MKRTLALAMVICLAAGFAVAAGAQEYDRYERGSAPPPPPPPPTQYQPAPPQYRPAPPPPMRLGIPHGGPYLSANVGLYEPNTYYDGLAQYDSGWGGNLTIGSRVSPFAAIEGGVGYYTASVGSNDVSVVPVTIGGRLILPNPTFEPYFGAGIGVYFVQLTEPPFIPPFNYVGTDSNDTTFGGYISFGLDMWLNPKLALNVEGRYQMAYPTITTNSGLNYDVDVSGWELNFGVRFGF